MSKPVSLDFIVRVFKIFNGFDGPCSDALWWRTDAPKYDPLTFLVLCNDFFFWGTADCEELTPDSIPDLEQACADIRAIKSKDELGKDSSYDDAPLLWVARCRKMRPQGAFYEHLDKVTWPLFDACGPERSAQFGNPRSRPAA